jgi:hypothetical protein
MDIIGEIYDYIFCHLMNNLKIYILIKDSLDIGHAVNCAAHASLMVYLKWQHLPIMKDWLLSFRKVSCKVSDKEFEEAKKYEDYLVVRESKLLNGEVALVFKPRNEWPEFFKYLKLYK